MHLSFDLSEPEPGLFKATSHNFPPCCGEGDSPERAIRMMDMEIMYIMDNHPDQFYENVRERIKKNLECVCGAKLQEKPICVYITRPPEHKLCLPSPA